MNNVCTIFVHFVSFHSMSARFTPPRLLSFPSPSSLSAPVVVIQESVFIYVALTLFRNATKTAAKGFNYVRQNEIGENVVRRTKGCFIMFSKSLNACIWKAISTKGMAWTSDDINRVAQTIYKNNNTHQPAILMTSSNQRHTHKRTTLRPSNLFTQLFAQKSIIASLSFT